MSEIWKPVQGFDSAYEVSNKGRVKRLAYSKRVNDILAREIPERMLTQHVINSGYKAVHLIDINGKRHNKTVHRLVATAFIPNPGNFPVVNHKDEDKTNNCVSNLEWCTQSHNMTWNSVNSRVALGNKGKRACNSIQVVDVNSGTVYDSIDSCRKATHIAWKTVKSMCDEDLDSYKEYKLRYANR